MPLLRRRRYAPKRALIRRKRLARRVPRPMRSIRSRQPVHHFKRSIYYNGAISGSTVMDVFGAQYFRLVDIPNFSEFTSLFDVYRINGVKISFMPRGNSAEAGTNQGLVKFFSVLDYDDISTPTSINDLLQYESLKVTNTSRNHTRYLKPKLAKVAYQTAVGNAYMPGTGWVDCQNTTVPHFGVKWGLQQLPAGTQQIDILLTFYMSFKNVL